MLSAMACACWRAGEPQPELELEPELEPVPEPGRPEEGVTPRGHRDMILGLAWMHTHLEGRGGHGTHGGFRERSERYQRHTLGGG